MRLIGLFCTVVCLAAFSSPSSAQDADVTRDIISMGCQKNSDECVVELNGEVFGPENCQATKLAFNLQKDVNAEASLMLLSAAFLAGKKVKFAVAAECYGSTSTELPTFDSFTVIN